MTTDVDKLFRLSRRGMLIGAVALVAACDSDNTPVVASTDDTMSYAGGAGGADMVGGGGASSGDYRLNPGDKMRIIVYGQNHLTGDYQLDSSGILAFPLAGQIKAAGMTPA